MKIFLSTAVALGVAAAAFADDVHLTSAVTDILKLSQSQVSPAVLEAFIANSPVAYSPSPDEIVYMHKQGVPDEVVAAMIRHGMENRPQESAAEAMGAACGVPMPQTPPPDMQAAQQAPPYAPAQPAPAVQEVVTTPYPTVILTITGVPATGAGERLDGSGLDPDGVTVGLADTAHVRLRRGWIPRRRFPWRLRWSRRWRSWRRSSLIPRSDTRDSAENSCCGYRRQIRPGRRFAMEPVFSSPHLPGLISN